MTPTEMVSKISDELHDQGLGTRPYDWINKVQEDMNARCYWSVLEVGTPYLFQIKAPVTAGTVTATNGSTTVTGSGTSFSNSLHAGQIIQIASESSYYFISSVSSSTSLTLTTPYIGTTGSGKTYSIDYLNYSLPSDVSVQKIKSIVIQNPHVKLWRMDQSQRDEVWPNLVGYRGKPIAYLDWGETKLQPYPLSDADYLAVIRYQKKPSEVNSDSTSFDWPAQYHWAILTGALALGWDWKDDQTMSEKVTTDYEKMLQCHIRENNRHMDTHSQMRAFDEDCHPQFRLTRLITGQHIG